MRLEFSVTKWCTVEVRKMAVHHNYCYCMLFCLNCACYTVRPNEPSSGTSDKL
jgi:hypothetical protein